LTCQAILKREIERKREKCPRNFLWKETGEFFVNFAQNNKYFRQKLWVSRFSLAQKKLCGKLREIFQKVNKTVRKTNSVPNLCPGGKACASKKFTERTLFSRIKPIKTNLFVLLYG
jgi:hypothetical protein